MKLIVVGLLLIGIIMIINGYQKQNLTCPPAVIKYKYIPRSFDEAQENEPKVSNLFKTMFSENSPGPI